MDNIKGVLEYIRNFFTSPLEIPRKRRAADTFEHLISPKCRKLSPTMSNKPTNTEDEWPFGRSTRSFNPSIPRFSRVRETIVLDDEDDIEIKKPSQSRQINRSKYTSTPADIHSREQTYTNGTEEEDDVQFIREEKSISEKKKHAKRAGLNYLSTLSSNLFEIRPVKSTTALHQNGTVPKMNKTASNMNIRSRNNSKNSSIDYSIRLDDKLKYKKLLENVSSDSSLYHTPVGKIFNCDGPQNRSSKILSMAQKSNERKLDRDLFGSRRLSTKDKIIKVLDDFETDPVVVRDSESEDDVIVCPPSPKPDIQVDPVNSLKTVVDCNEHSKKDWLINMLDRHKKTIEVREKQIQELQENCDSYGNINRDIRRLHITKKINESLLLKEAVLPVEEPVEEVELPELTDQHLKLVKKAFSGDPHEVLVKKFNLNITRRDLMTLAGLNWLNDEVINFYMNLIMERGKNSQWPKAYAMNTFFYSKIIKDGPLSVKRWTKRIDIFSYDIICVPIHLGMHWCMAVINLREKSIKYYDSMGSTNNRCLEALREYLEAEHFDKKKTEYDTSEFILENVKDIPQQMNGSDCGMFSCTFAEFLTRNAKITFSQEDMPYLRKKMVVEIMTGDLLIK